MKHHHHNRRSFIKQSACAALGSTSLLSSLVNLSAANAASMANSTVAMGDDYKALVCILLGGGNDAFNMLVPNSFSEYNVYKNSRSNLAIPRHELLPLDVINSDGRTFGVHPSMPEIQQLFNDEKLAFISNIGTLVEPIQDKFQIRNQSKRVPLGLLSHADQQMHWQTAFPSGRAARGWGGKVADLISDMNEDQRVSMNISLSGSNAFQTGNKTVEFSIDAQNGSSGIYGYRENGLFNEARSKAIDNMLDQTYDDVFKKTYINTIRNAKDAHELFSKELENIGSFEDAGGYDEWRFAESLHMVAKVIKARQGLGARRQTFFINFDGWDHHDEVIQTQAQMLKVLSKGMNSFQKMIESLGIEEEVTSFVISDFARTLSSNGNGTDHGWGTNVFAMGGAIKGGRIYGDYPSLELNSNIDLSGGIFIPTTSADLYFAELTEWFGVSRSELDLIFPHLSEFDYDSNPLGFLLT